MPVPTSLLTLNPLPSPRVSRLQTSLISMMSTTKNLKIIPRIIIRPTILGTNDMIDLIRMSTTRTQHAIITDHRILATPPVIIQHLTTRPLPTRIEPFLAMRLIPIVGHHHSSVLQEGIEPSRHRTTHFECAASTIPPPKQKNRQPPCHTHQKHGDCPASNPNRHKEIQWQKRLFTASHGARMLRESNPRTVPGRHLSKVVQ